MAQIDVFISHANADKSMVRPLVDALLHDGFAVFVDNPIGMKFNYDEICYWENKNDVKLLHCLEGGEDTWPKQLEDAIKKAGVVLGVLSPSILGFRKVLYQEMLKGHTLEKLYCCSVGGGPSKDNLDKFFLNEDGNPCLFAGQAQQRATVDETILKQLVVHRGSGEWPEFSNLKSEEQTCLSTYCKLRDEIQAKIGRLASQRRSAPDAMIDACKKFFIEHIEQLTAKARTAFAEGLKQRVSLHAAQLLEANKPIELAAELAPENIGDVIGAVGSGLAELRKMSSATGEDFAGLRGISSAIAPMIAALRDDEVAKVERSVGEGGFSFVELSIGAYTMAEIIAAASGKRQVRMREHSSRTEDPMGELALQLGAENGPDDYDGVYGAGDFIAELVARGSSLADNKSVDGRIQSDASEFSKHIWQTVKDRLGYFKSEKRIKRHLRQERLSGDPQHYLLVRMPESRGEREYIKTVLKRVHEELPGILMLVIGPAEAYEEDEELLETFWYTLRE